MIKVITVTEQDEELEKQLNDLSKKYDIISVVPDRFHKNHWSVTCHTYKVILKEKQ